MEGTMITRLAPLTLCVALLPAADWITLFDGKSFQSWKDPARMSPAGDAWTIEDGCLASKAHAKLREDLVSERTFGDFELEFEWRIQANGNSGVKYRIQDFATLTSSNRPPKQNRFEDWVDYVLLNRLSDRSKMRPQDDNQIYVIGFEYQMIDDGGHADAKRGSLYQAGGLYSMVGPSKPMAKPVGQFNQSRIVVRGNHTEHWLNRVKVVSANLDDPVVRETLAKRWGKQSPVYKLLTESPKKNCPISLQNHDDKAWFRKIRIRPL